MAIYAVTGGTGFVGQRLIAHLAQSGHVLRALTRRPQASHANVEWISGDLDHASSLHALCSGADAVIHLAGVIKGRRYGDFEHGNVAGTSAILRAAADSGVRRLLHMSSLAARAPHLSHYARSKAAAEALVTDSKLDWTILRPAAVYGPGDTETLRLFKAAAGLVLPIPAGRGLVSWLHADDLATATEAAIARETIGRTIELDDGAGGILHRTFAETVRRAVGGPALILPVPGPLLSLAGLSNMAIAYMADIAPMLSAGKAREIRFPDWRVSDRQLQTLTGWRPARDLATGTSETAAWYRAAHWI